MAGLAALGVFVYLGNNKRQINKLFGLFNLVALLWILSQLIYGISSNEATILIAFKFSLFFGQTISLLLLVFAANFPYRENQWKPLVYIFIAANSIVGLLSFTTLSISSVEKLEYGARPLVQGSLYDFSDYLAVVTVVLAMVLLIKKMQKTKSVLHKRQIKLLLIAISITIVGNILSGIVFLDYFKNDLLSVLASNISLVLFSLIVGYTVIQHKLFSIRSVVARAVVYLLFAAIITLAYILIGFFLKRLILPDLNSSIPQLISNVVLTFLILISYPSLKKQFDKLSNRLFYRDAYDPQQFIDELNQILVTTVELQALLIKCAALISDKMKVTSSSFFIRETSYFGDRSVGTLKKPLVKNEVDIIQQLSIKLHKKVHNSEAEPLTEIENELNTIMQKHEVDVLARLVSTLDYEVGGIGFLFIGPKKSGEPFSTQDLQIIEIIVNELVIAVENALKFEEIEQFNVTLQKKIDEATNELKRSNEKLKALDEAKDEFVSMASHQLRTPLTSIKGYISMVVEGDAGEINDTQKQMLGQALFSSQRMVYLISDLLNVSRLKTGKFIIESKPVYLPNIVESELSQLHEGAAAKNITLAYVKPKSFPTLNLDDMKIRQVIMNFTDNAIYYTPSGGKITVALKDKKESIELTVKDTGIGVPKAERHKLFAKFYRAENARKARPDGTGLGLFMAKKVIVAQGGSVLFDSKEGKGSTFGFSFPKKHLLEEPPTDAK